MGVTLENQHKDERDKKIDITDDIIVDLSVKELSDLNVLQWQMS
jgi:hypothetical protein